MNRSRIRRLEKMAKPDDERVFLVVMKYYGCDRFYLQDDPPHIYPSEEKAVEAWRSKQDKQPRILKVVIVVTFKDIDI